ncbi:MAG: glycosyltransferase [Steroidobacteraceae bacterium]
MTQVDSTHPAIAPVEGAPFISIVTVSLNAAGSIEDTIASVSAQQVDFAVEQICVDGGSVDGTRAIIDHCASAARIVRIYEPDSGIFDAMNKGLRAATGEYVLFLNADDFLVAPTTLARVVEGLAPGSAANPDLIAGDVSMGRLGSWGVWRHRRVPRLLARLRGCGLFPLHQGLFTKRRLLEAVGGFDQGLKFSSDVIQYYELERKFRPTMRFIRADVAFMRAGGRSNADVRSMYRATKEFYRRLRLNYTPLRAAGMVFIKTLQSLEEVRIGRCPHERWFASAIQAQPGIAAATPPAPRSRQSVIGG